MVQNFSMFRMGFAKCQTFRYDKCLKAGMRVEFLQGIRKEELPQENRVGGKNSRPQLMAHTGTKEEGSITAKIFLPWKGQATKWWEQQCHPWSNLNYNSVVSNINISVPSLSKAQTPQRPRNFATSTTSTFKTATRTATIFCACHYWESTVSWILNFADNSSIVHWILEIWIYLKINAECDEDLVKRRGGINFGNIVPFEKRQHHFQSSENNFFIEGRWKINNSKYFPQEYIKVNEKNTPLSKRAKTGNIQTKSVLWVGEGDVEETNCSPTIWKRCVNV